MLGTPEALHLPQPQSLLGFTARSYGDFSSQHWNHGLEVLVWGWNPGLLGDSRDSRAPPQPRYPSQFLTTTHAYGSSMFCVSTSPTCLDVGSSLCP